MMEKGCPDHQASALSLISDEISQGKRQKSGFGPVELWVMGPHRTRVVTFNAITTQGLSDNSLSTRSATTSVPGAVDKENHFLLVITRRTNWQSSRPGGYRDVINNGNKGYRRGSTPRCLHKQGIIAAQII